MTEEKNDKNDKSAPTITYQTIKRSKHPNAPKYFGFQAFEYTNALMEIAMAMDKEERAIYADPNGILDKESFDKFIEEVKVGDVIGVSFNTHLVKEKTKDGFKTECVTDKKRDFVGNKEIDMALLVDCCEILYRDREPYNCKKDIKVKIVDYSKKKEDASLTTSNEEQTK